MKCPSCGLTNPPGAQFCDCGYRFEGAVPASTVARAAPFAGDFSGRLYWFDLRGLERDLARAQYFSSRSLFIYILAEALLLSLPSFSDAFPQEASSFDVVKFAGALFGVGLTFWGLRHVYDSNGGDSGKDFLPRLVTLGWVWGWQFAFLVCIPSVVGVAILAAYLGVSFTPLFVLLGVGIWLVYYVVLANRMKEVRQAHEAFMDSQLPRT